MQPNEATDPVVAREPDASKGARPVLRGEGGREASFLPSTPQSQNSHPLPETVAGTAAADIGLIIVGDEILSGKRQDKHLARVIELLSARGLALAWARYVGDDRPLITAALRDAFAGGSFAKRAWDWEKALLGGKSLDPALVQRIQRQSDGWAAALQRLEAAAAGARSEFAQQQQDPAAAPAGVPRWPGGRPGWHRSPPSPFAGRPARPAGSRPPSGTRAGSCSV